MGQAETKLFHSVYTNEPASVVNLLRDNASKVNCTRVIENEEQGPVDTQCTLLMVAAWLGHTEIVEVLVDHGAQLFASPMSTVTNEPLEENGAHISATDLALRRGHVEIARYLVSKGAPEPVSGWDQAEEAAAKKEVALDAPARIEPPKSAPAGHLEVNPYQPQAHQQLQQRHELSHSQPVGHIAPHRHPSVGSEPHRHHSVGEFTESAPTIMAPQQHQPPPAYFQPRPPSPQMSRMHHQHHQHSASVPPAHMAPMGDMRWNINYAEVKLGKELGRGAFGVVYAGTYRLQDVAIKVVANQPTAKALQEFWEETALMANLRPHKNVVTFMGVSRNPLCLITELVAGGSLESRLEAGKPDVQWSDFFRWARGIAAGMHHLHLENVLHRDLATRNILLDANSNAEVADFGLSKKSHGQEATHATQERQFFRGPYKWMAPESLANNVFSTKTDVWGFGVTLWEILTRRLPFEFLDIYTVKNAVVNSRLRLPCPQRWPQMVRNLLVACWRTSPVDRPNMETLANWLYHMEQDVTKKPQEYTQLPVVSEAEVRALYGMK